jgi:hypothetical protein
VSVNGWQASQARQISERLGAEVEVESLDLEDIFLELHR